MGIVRKLARLMLSLVVLVTALWTGVVPAHAASSMKLTAAVGLNGFYDRYGWVPVTVTMGPSKVTTDAVIRVDINDAFDASRNALGALEWGIHLQAGKTATREISVPGWAVYRNAVVECLVHNRVVARTSLSGNELGKVALVGVLSDRAESAQFLTGSTDGAGGLPVLPMTFGPNSLPTHANLLQSLSAVVTSPSELARLDAAHQRGLVDWVNLGGLLVVTGTSAEPKAWEADLLPLLAGPSHKGAGNLIAQFAGSPSLPPNRVQVSASGAKAGARVFAGTDSAPLVAAMTVGRGTVVETAFAATEPALLSWSNNASLWTHVFSMDSAEEQSALPPKLTAAPLDTLASASAVLAPLRVPSLPFWAGMFAVYVILVGPVLFFVLRRFRGEPWAWIVLPVLSLVTTLVMYSFGVRDRPQGLLTEGIGVVDLVGNGAAEGYGVRSFMSPIIGPVDVTSRGQMMVLPLTQKDLHTPDGTTVYHGTNTVVHYPEVGRWSLHDVVSEGAAPNEGQVELQLWSTQKQLSGTVRNDTPYQLHDVALCWNGRLVTLGDMGPGTVIQLGKATPSVSASGGYLSAYGSYNRDMTRGIGRSLANFAGQTNLLSGLQSTSDVLLVATTTDRTPGVAHVVSQVRTSSDKTLVLVREFGQVAIYPDTGVNME